MSVFQWYSDFANRFRGFLPELLTAAAIFAAGWVLALVFRFLVRRFLTRMLDRAGSGRLADGGDARLRRVIPGIAAGFAFWGLWLFFISAAVEALGFTIVTDILRQTVYYLPNVLAAVAIGLAGIFMARLGRRAATTGARSAGMVGADRAGIAVQWVITIVAFVVASDQVGIDAQLVVILLAVVTATTIGSAGLAFGMGARNTVGNIIASHYFTQVYRVGQTIRIGDIEGEIIRTTPTAVLVETQDGRMLIPARRFNDEPSLLVSGG